MEEEANVKILKQAYAEFSRGNIPAVLDLLADDVEWTDPGYPDLPYAGARRGKKQVEDFFIKLNEYVELTRFEPRSFIAEGDTVVALGYFEGKAKSTGKTFSSDWSMVWKLAKGKITYYHAYVDTATVAKTLKS